VAAQLASVDDYLVFKKMMAARYKHHFGDFSSEKRNIAVDESDSVEQVTELDARQQTQQVLALLYKRQSVSTAAFADAQPEAPTTSTIPECDAALPPMPEMVANVAATTARPIRGSLPSISSDRIAAIVAGAARAKTDDKEKAALVNLASNSKIALLRGGGC